MGNINKSIEQSIFSNISFERSMFGSSITGLQISRLSLSLQMTKNLSSLITKCWSLNSFRRCLSLIASATVVLLLVFSPFAFAKKFSNPILPGYHPDPSIIRVEENYYLVNSTFEWFPGIPIYHSKDLVNWQLIGHGIHRPEQLNLQEGLPDYMGIFAVTIRYHEGMFYLITTCVQCEKGGNFYITASDPSGPWSNPIWLDSPGIDPSLMWDDDGKAYYVGHGNLSGKQDWKDQQGVWLQEFDDENGKLIGPKKQLTFGHANNAVWTEGPHLYKINGKYLLMVAEGGTGYHHAVTVHHADSVWGPYTADPVNPVLSHRQLGKDYPIHSIGHADLVQTQTGDWWSVMLGKRYIDGYTLLARETFLTPVEFQGQTPIFNPGVGKVLIEDERPKLPWSPFKQKPTRDNFDREELSLEWNLLRTPHTKWYSLEKEKLKLKLRKYTLDELKNPSFIARRIEDHKFSATLHLEFSTKTEKEYAGMALYRSSACHYLFAKTKDHLIIEKTLKGNKVEVARIPYHHDKVILRAEADGLDLNFSYGRSNRKLRPIGDTETMSVIAFESASGFNGPYVGMYASSNGLPSTNSAHFDWFEYQGMDKRHQRKYEH